MARDQGVFRARHAARPKVPGDSWGFVCPPTPDPPPQGGEGRGTNLDATDPARLWGSPLGPTIPPGPLPGGPVTFGMIPRVPGRILAAFRRPRRIRPGGQSRRRSGRRRRPGRGRNPRATEPRAAADSGSSRSAMRPSASPEASMATRRAPPRDASSCSTTSRKLLVCGPNRTEAPKAAGSIMFWPPRPGREAPADERDVGQAPGRRELAQIVSTRITGGPPRLDGRLRALPKPGLRSDGSPARPGRFSHEATWSNRSAWRGTSTRRSCG